MLPQPCLDCILIPICTAVLSWFTAFRASADENNQDFLSEFQDDQLIQEIKPAPVQLNSAGHVLQERDPNMTSSRSTFEAHTNPLYESKISIYRSQPISVSVMQQACPGLIIIPSYSRSDMSRCYILTAGADGRDMRTGLDQHNMP